MPEAGTMPVGPAQWRAHQPPWRSAPALALSTQNRHFRSPGVLSTRNRSVIQSATPPLPPVLLPPGLRAARLLSRSRPAPDRGTPAVGAPPFGHQFRPVVLRASRSPRSSSARWCRRRSCPDRRGEPVDPQTAPEPLTNQPAIRPTPRRRRRQGGLAAGEVRRAGLRARAAQDDRDQPAATSAACGLLQTLSRRSSSASPALAAAAAVLAMGWPVMAWGTWLAWLRRVAGPEALFGGPALPSSSGTGDRLSPPCRPVRPSPSSLVRSSRRC